MSSQAVMKRQILALAKREPSNEELQKIKQSLAVYKKLTKEEQAKINEMVTNAHAKLDSEGKFAKGGTTKTQSMKTALTEFKNKIGAKKFKRATTGTDIKKDIGIPAQKVGKRIVRKKGKTTNQYGTFKNQVGTTYYEGRPNRSDVNQPSEKRKIKLAKGGSVSKGIEQPSYEEGIMISKPFYSEEKSFFGLAKGYKITNQFKENITAEFIISKNLGISKKDALDKANAFYNFCKKAKTWEQYEDLSSEFIKEWNAKEKYAKGGEVKEKSPKFKVGDKVYSYQNKSESAPIAYARFSAWDKENGAHENDVWKYKLSLKDGYSNWINEESLSKTKMTTYAEGGEVSQYIDGLSKQEVLSKTIVYDNGGESYDRYTIFTPDGSVYGMSETAEGFNQYLGDSSEIEKGKHLGRKLRSVPKGIQGAVLDRMLDDEQMFAKGGKLSKEDALQKAIDMGVDFEKDFHAQSVGNELAELAKESGYKKSASSSGSTGRAFFYHLQKIYDKRKYAEGGEIEVGSIVNLPEIKMKDGRVQYERVVGGEVIGIEDGIYDVLNPKTNRLHRVTKQQIEQIDQAKAKHTRSRGSLRSNEDTYPQGTEFADGGLMTFSPSVNQSTIEELQGKFGGVTIKKMRTLLEQMFPYSFGFDLFEITDPKQQRTLIPTESKGIQDDSIKIYFDNHHSMTFRVFQGGENTYFYFGLTSDEKEYIGTFGFKDEGDVESEYVTSFIAFLCKMYGYPFQVNHSVYAKGGTIKKSLAEFKNKVGDSKYREATRGVDIKADLQIPALKKGRRVVTKKGKTSNQYGTFKNQVGSVYYENRPNHYDVNQPSEKRKIKLADGGVLDSLEGAKVYVADLAEYNDGRLVGKWFNLSDYASGADLMEAIQEMLDEQTAKDKSGEVHEEWAVHDFEGFPRSFYSEYMGEKDFEKLYQIADVANDRGIPIDVLMEAVAHFGADEDQIEEIADGYYGSVSTNFGNEFKDFAYEYIDSIGSIADAVSNPDFYFDFESFGSDARMDYTEEELEEYGYDELDDTELGERLVDEMGGVDQLGQKTIEMYFDYDKFGRDLEHDFISVKGDDGDYYFFNRNW